LIDGSVTLILSPDRLGSIAMRHKPFHDPVTTTELQFSLQKPKPVTGSNEQSF